MRKIIIFFAISIVLILSACDEGVYSDIPNQTAIDIDYQDNSNVSPIILLSEHGENKNSGLVIAGVKNGKLLNVEDFLFNDKHIEELDISEKNIDSNLIISGNVIKTYDLEYKEDSIVCKSVDYSRDNIDSNHFVWVNFDSTINLPEPYIGISCNWNPLPRNPQIDDGTIVIDIDGNGIVDTISWEITKSEDAYNQLIINTDYNDKNLTISKNCYPEYRNSIISVLDINGDSKMELVIYLNDIGSSISIYAIEDMEFTELLNFSIYNGP